MWCFLLSAHRAVCGVLLSGVGQRLARMTPHARRAPALPPGLAAIVVRVGMHDQRLAEHIVRRAGAQADAAEHAVEMRHAFAIGHQVVHVAEVVRPGRITAVGAGGRIEMRAGATGIHGAAIAALMHVETEVATRTQATDRSSSGEHLVPPATAPPGR